MSKVENRLMLAIAPAALAVSACGDQLQEDRFTSCEAENKDGWDLVMTALDEGD